MPVKNYGVFKGFVEDGFPQRNDPSPHYHIRMIGEEGVNYRIAINIKSTSKKITDPQKALLLYSGVEVNGNAITFLSSLKNGFTPINDSNREFAIDYIRSKLFNPPDMIVLPHNKDGADNDLNDLLDKYIIQAKKENAPLYVYGSRFDSKDGMHNVHMNQGNSVNEEHADDNGIYHDGCILIQYQTGWFGIFLAFQTQSWCTDNDGNPTRECSHKEPL